MVTFVDKAGDSWEVGLTVADFARLRAVGTDLNQVLQSGEKLAELLFGDPERLGRVAWTLCEPQAAARNLSPEAFAGRFDGPTLERLGEAVGEAVADFFPRSKVAAAIKGRMKTALDEMDVKVIGLMIAPAPRNSPGGSPASSA